MDPLPAAVLAGLLLFAFLALGATVFRAWGRGSASDGNGGSVHRNGVTRVAVAPSATSRTLVFVAVIAGVALLAVALPPHHVAQLVAGVIVGTVVATSVERGFARRRLERFTASLPDALDLLASALRTGQPIRAGLDLVAREMPPPLGSEFAVVVREIELGMGEVEALEGMADRLDSIDVQMLVTSIAVQKEVGGNLAEILTTLAQTIRSRFRIQGQVNAYTAQARLSAKVLVALPVAFAAILYVIRPSYLSILVTDPSGRALLMAALLGWVAGWMVIRRILAVSV